MRKILLASVILMASFGVAMGEEFSAFISKVEDGKVTFIKFSFPKKGDKKGDKKGKGESTTLPAADNVKVTKTVKFDPETKKFETEAVKDGLKNEIFKTIDKGLFARITTDEDGKKITEIRVGGGFKGKGKGKDKGTEKK